MLFQYIYILKLQSVTFVNKLTLAVAWDSLFFAPARVLLGTEPVSWLEGKDPFVIVLFIILHYTYAALNPNDPLNMLKNSPKLAHTSGLVKKFIKCKN